MLIWYEKRQVEGKDIAVRCSAYVDQIMDGDNKQDAVATASMVEAVIELISKDSRFRDVSQAIIQSDNAKCYQSNEFRVLLMLINSSMNNCIKIRRHIFSETQDGKSLLDAHFGCCQKVVRKSSC
jgi:hypothetical protein